MSEPARRIADRVLVPAGLLLACLAATPAAGQQIHRDAFSGRATAWVRGEADARYTLQAHDLSPDVHHGPPASEHFKLDVELGSFVHFDYPIPRAPVTDDLSGALWVKSTRKGVRLKARVVLPRERHPTRIDEPLTALIDGGRYELVGGWQQLDLGKPVRALNDARQLLRTQLKRDINIEGAYVDRLVLDLYPGTAGAVEIWVDDLSVGPVELAKAVAAPGARPAPGDTGPAVPGPPASATVPTITRPERAAVELNRDRLLVGGKPFFFRAIRHSDVPLEALRLAGFNTLWVGPDSRAEDRERAADLGFWLAVGLPDARPGSVATLTGRPKGAAGGDEWAAVDQLVGREVSRFAPSDAVLFWQLGEGRTAEDEKLVSRSAQAVRLADPHRPLTAGVWDGLWPYSRQLDMVNVHRFPLMTSLELDKYRDWLNQRRELARPGTFVWTWVQTHLPDWAPQLVYDRPAGDTAAYDEPAGPQPEQVRLLTYVALSAGVRGIGYWSDRWLADSHQGRGRLLALALLNQEMQMLEPMLLSLSDPPTWETTTDKNVQAAVLRTDRGILVVPIWLGSGAQYVPGQAANPQLKLVVPQVPTGMMAWQVTPGEVRSLRTDRVVGGTMVTVPDFGLTTAIVFTNDTGPDGVVARWQNQARDMAKQAAQWSYDLAVAELEKVEKVHAELERVAPAVPDAGPLLEDARRRVQLARRHWDAGDHRAAYQEAQRALRPVRILMRAHWENASRTLDTPSASPYAVSFYSLPRHWQLWRDVRARSVTPDALLGGDFEANPRSGEQKLPLGEEQRRRAGPQQLPGRLTTARGQGPDPFVSPAPSVRPDPEPGVAPTQAPVAEQFPLEDWTDPRCLPSLDAMLGAVNPAGGAGTNTATGQTGTTPKTAKDDPRKESLRANQQLKVLARAVPDSWRVDAVALDDVNPEARLVNVRPAEGRECLQLKIRPRPPEVVTDRKQRDPLALERTFLAVSSPEVRLAPGTLVRVSCWIRVPRSLTATADGALFYDSVGGQALAVRVTGATGEWKKYSLYRKVPASGRIFVTAALSGLGVVYFDDIRIEPLAGTPTPDELTGPEAPPAPGPTAPPAVPGPPAGITVARPRPAR